MAKKSVLFNKEEYKINRESGNEDLGSPSGAKKTSKSGLVQCGYYLTPEIKKSIKKRALEDDTKDYIVVQRALEAYLHLGES